MSIPILVVMLAAAPSVLRVTSPEAVARTEAAIGPGQGYETQHCVSGLRYQPEPLVVSTSARGLGKRRLLAIEGFLAGTKAPRAELFADVMCWDEAFTPALDIGELKASFAEARGVIGSWSQDACGSKTSVVVVARSEAHVVVASFQLKYVFGGKYTCDERVLETDKDCAARDECLKQYFADPAHAQALRDDLGRALGALVFTP